MAKISGPTIICTNTLRTRDLAPKYLDALYELGDDAAKRADKIRSEHHDEFMLVQRGQKNLSSDLWAPTLMDALVDALEEFAPEGTYFGSHEGDGACFGFWEYEPVGYAGEDV